MKTRDRVLMLGLCGSTLCLAGVQCEDAASARRTEIEATIVELSGEFASLGAQVVSPGSEAFETRRTRLTSMVGKAGGIRDADGGQKSALSSLRAAGLRELALMKLAEANAIEDGLRQQRTEVAHQIMVAQWLDAVANGQVRVDLEHARDQLRANGTEAEHQRRDSSLRMAELDGPIADLESGNRQDQAEIDRVSARAGELRREAAAMGAADGFGKFQEAIELEKQVDQYEVRMAYREIDLDFDLHPEHRLAETYVNHAQALIEIFATSEQHIDAFMQAVAADASVTRQMVRELDQLIGSRLDEAFSPGGLEIDNLFGEAVSDLEQAISAAGSAVPGRGDAADSGRLVKARLQSLLGEVHLTQLRSVEGRIGVLEQLIGAGDGLASGPRLSSALDLMTTKRSEAEAAAMTAFKEAQDTLGGVSSRTARKAADALTSSIGAALTALGDGGEAGEAGEQPMSLPGGGQPMSLPSDDGAPAGGGDGG